VGKDKSEKALKPFWRLLGKLGKRIGAVAIDMGAAYHKAIKTIMPEAAIVFDHFNVVKMMNDRIDQLRREVYREAGEKERNVIFGSRHVLLKNPENLSGKNYEKERLDRLSP
jgi:transposase